MCQNTDCETAPYLVNVDDNYFNPPFVSVPNGGRVIFSKVNNGTPHKATGSTNSSQCLIDQSGRFDFLWGTFSQGQNYTTAPLTTAGDQQYVCTYHCSTTQPQSMIGVIRVGPPPPTFCQKCVPPAPRSTM